MHHTTCHGIWCDPSNDEWLNRVLQVTTLPPGVCLTVRAQRTCTLIQLRCNAECACAHTEAERAAARDRDLCSQRVPLCVMLYAEVEKDCGAMCSAYSYLDKDLPLVSFSFMHNGEAGIMTGLGLVYEAAPEAYSKVRTAISHAH
eukprot:7386412-Prymnesium_polylepis.1